jgi:hypothetical protein
MGQFICCFIGVVFLIVFGKNKKAIDKAGLLWYNWQAMRE